MALVTREGERQIAAKSQPLRSRAFEAKKRPCAIPAFAVGRAQTLLFHLARLKERGRIAALGLTDMAPLVRQVYRSSQIDPLHSRFADFARQLNWTLREPSAPWFRDMAHRRFITDAVEELSGW